MACYVITSFVSDIRDLMWLYVVTKFVVKTYVVL